MEPVASRGDIHSRLIPAPPHEVLAAIGDAARIARGWAPNGFTNTTHEFDFKPGRRWSHWRFNFSLFLRLESAVIACFLQAPIPPVITRRNSCLQVHPR